MLVHGKAGQGMARHGWAMSGVDSSSLRSAAGLSQEKENSMARMTTEQVILAPSRRRLHHE